CGRTIEEFKESWAAGPDGKPCCLPCWEIRNSPLKPALVGIERRMELPPAAGGAPIEMTRPRPPALVAFVCVLFAAFLHWGILLYGSQSSGFRMFAYGNWVSDDELILGRTSNALILSALAIGAGLLALFRRRTFALVLATATIVLSGLRVLGTFN